ncbi:hypothetical protein APY03_0793 [Variovorax sp. WDL1]|nr:hypothetical protein APY03_0793 [Variovorax sp. WDL1]
MPSSNGQAFQRVQARAAYLELPKPFVDALPGLYGDIYFGRMLGLTPNEIRARTTR